MEKTKNLRQLIHQHRATFLEQGTMMRHEIEIQNLIGNLDQVVIAYEAKWGADRLHELVPDELRQKWFKQYDKLCVAITSSDLPQLEQLVPGTIRGYAMLEAAAAALGHVPYDPVFWEVQLPESYRTVRIVKNNADAAIVLKAGVETWTLEEIARVLDEKLRIYSQVKELWPDAKVTVVKSAFDFEKGDEINF